MLSPSGLFVTSLIQLTLLIPLVLMAATFKTQPWHETLAIRKVAFGTVFFWLLVHVGFLVAQSVANLVFPVELGDAFTDLAGTRHFGLMLFVVVVAPVIEEFVFRGYLYTAWRQSRLGLVGALILTSLMFTGLHAFQYQNILLIYVSVLSLLLGLAREKTGSLLVLLAMHMFNNLVAGIGLIYLGTV